MSSDTTQFLAVPAMAKKYAAAGFTESGLRWLLFNREHNGFDNCVVTIGRKVLIDEPAFVAWLRSRPTSTSGQEASRRSRQSVRAAA